MKIKNREHVEDLLKKLLGSDPNIDYKTAYHIAYNIDKYSPAQLATLTDHLISWHDNKTRKKVFKVLNQIRYIEDEQINLENVPCVPFNLPILYKIGSVIDIPYFGDDTLAVVIGTPNRETKYFDFSDECYLVWVIPHSKEEVDICYGYAFSVEHLLEGRFHDHPHMLYCKPVDLDNLSKYGDSKWIDNCINICKQALKKLEEEK